VLLLIGGLEWFTKGSWAMYPLALLSIYALFVILNRLLFFALHVPRTNRELDNVLRGTSLLPERLAGELAPLLARGVRERRLDAKRAELAVEHELLEGSRYLNSLDTTAQVSPMLGLTGTVTGMIRAFQGVAEGLASAKPVALAGGVSQALYTTAAGLTIAIIALLPYNALTRKVEKVTRYLEQLVTCYEVTVQKGQENR